MSKCGAYWRAKDLGKECGVPENKYLRDCQDNYRNGVVKDLMSMGAKEDDVFDYLKYTVLLAQGRLGDKKHKPISFIALKKESPYRKKMLDFFFQQIVSGKQISKKDIVDAGFVSDDWTDDDFRQNYHAKSAGHVIFGKTYQTNRMTAVQSIIKNLPNAHPNAASCTGSLYSLTTKISKILDICTSGQFGILQLMNQNGYGDNEYAAFCIALKWAAEKIEYEKAHKGDVK